MDIGKEQPARTITLPARETAPSKPERQPFRRKEPATPTKAPVKVPAKRAL